MKYNKNSKIELQFVKEQFNRRAIYYRIVPSELSFIKRSFFNPWKPLFMALKWVGGKTYKFGLDDYREKILPLKTLGDVLDYLDQEQRTADRLDREIEAIRSERVKYGLEWPE